MWVYNGLQVVLVEMNLPFNTGDKMRHGFDPWVGKISWRRRQQPTPVFLPEESNGQRSLAGYSVTWVQTRLTRLSMHAPCATVQSWLRELLRLCIHHLPTMTNSSTSCVAQSFSCVWFFVTPWTAAHQAFLSFTTSRSLLKLMYTESVMPSYHLILCCPLLLLLSVFPSIRVSSNDLALCIRWPKYWNFSFSISPSNEYSGLISFGIDW